MAQTFGLFVQLIDLNLIKTLPCLDVVETNWLPKCAISLSPAKDILVVAYCNKMMVLECKFILIFSEKISNIFVIQLR